MTARQMLCPLLLASVALLAAFIGYGASGGLGEFARLAFFVLVLASAVTAVSGLVRTRQTNMGRRV